MATNRAPQEVLNFFNNYDPMGGMNPNRFIDSQGYEWGALTDGDEIFGGPTHQKGGWSRLLRSNEPGRKFNEVGSEMTYFKNNGDFELDYKSDRAASWGEQIVQLATAVAGIGAVGAAAGVPLGTAGAAGGAAGAVGTGAGFVGEGALSGVGAWDGALAASPSWSAAGAAGGGTTAMGAGGSGGGMAGTPPPANPYASGGGNWLTSALGGSGGGGGMAFSWTDLIGPALNFAGQAYAGKQAGDAGDDLAQAAREAAALYEPWRQAGSWAIGQSANMLGKSGPEAAKAAFYQDPGYQWRVSQGENGLTRARAAQGLLGSGKYLKDAMNYNQGQASQEFGNAFNRLQAVAGMGQTATNGAAGYNTDAASAAAAGKIAQGNALTNGIGQGWSMYQNSQQQNQNNALMQQFLGR